TASRRVRRQARLRVRGSARRLHHRGHGRRSRLRRPIGAGSHRARAETRREILQGLKSSYFDDKNTLGLLFMLPAGVLLLLFLTYPLGLGTWLGFTDAKIGRTGQWIGIENFQFLFGDTTARLSLFNT